MLKMICAKSKALLFAFVLLAAVGGVNLSSAFGMQAAEEFLEDPALEERAREISKGLRCVVCKNQSIDQSNASLAKDLRILVRDRLKEGYTDEEVVDYIVGSYGEFVLLKPKLSMKNMFLWTSPLLVFIGGAFLAVSFLRGQKLPEHEVLIPLSEDEKEALQRLSAEHFIEGDGPQTPVSSPPTKT